MTRAELSDRLIRYANLQRQCWEKGTDDSQAKADAEREALIDVLTTWRDLETDPPKFNEAIVVKAVVSGEEMLVNENYKPLDSAYPAGAEWMSLEVQ